MARRAARRSGGAEPQAVPERSATEQPPAPASISLDDQVAKVEELGKLKEEGLITEEEFAAKKQQILAM
jgi:hypothetical protein